MVEGRSRSERFSQLLWGATLVVVPWLFSWVFSRGFGGVDSQFILMIRESLHAHSAFFRAETVLRLLISFQGLVLVVDALQRWLPESLSFKIQIASHSYGICMGVVALIAAYVLVNLHPDHSMPSHSIVRGEFDAKLLRISYSAIWLMSYSACLFDAIGSLWRIQLAVATRRHL